MCPCPCAATAAAAAAAPAVVVIIFAGICAAAAAAASACVAFLGGSDAVNLLSWHPLVPTDHYAAPLVMACSLLPAFPFEDFAGFQDVVDPLLVGV